MQTTNPTSEARFAAAARYVGDHLEANGVRVLSAAVKTQFGVLAIVAVDGEALVFGDLRVAEPGQPFTPPIGAFDANTQHHLRRCAAAWVNQTRDTPKPAREYRWDAFGVTVDERGTLESIHHVQAAY